MLAGQGGWYGALKLTICVRYHSLRFRGNAPPTGKSNNPTGGNTAIDANVSGGATEAGAATQDGR